MSKKKPAAKPKPAPKNPGLAGKFVPDPKPAKPPGSLSSTPGAPDPNAPPPAEKPTGRDPNRPGKL